ncbi:MAG: hypothetical protein KAQ94_09905 [Arcobacteraceae bacterium]|nr:hypothetical protein [Arcobacteraceae bacterium]
MGFITGLTPAECDLCKKAFVATAIGSSHPYDVYSCKNSNCNWYGQVCGNCKKTCPICGSKLISTHEQCGGNLFY